VGQEPLRRHIRVILDKAKRGGLRESKELLRLSQTKGYSTKDGISMHSYSLWVNDEARVAGTKQIYRFVLKGGGEGARHHEKGERTTYSKLGEKG